MKIINLIEDTPGNSGCLYEHGLSFYIETENRKLLLDTGASDAFITNAENKGIDLTAVDTVVISHGHYDHAGGLLAFVRRNPNAKIYICRNATLPYYNLKNGGTKYIGMDPRIAELPQAVFLSGDYTIGHGITLFSCVTGTRLVPRGNALLQRRQGDAFVPDTFDHEQYLVIREGEKTVLLSGCAHRGILNILDAYREVYGAPPTHVISGFHTVKAEYTAEDDAIIEDTARQLARMETVFYTGHCTGEYPMRIFRQIMGERLIPICSGDRLL